MPLRFRRAFIRHLLPQNLPVVTVQAIDLPGVFRDIFGRLHIAIKPMPENRLGIARNRGGDKHLPAPNHWTRMRKPWNRSLPEYVFILSRIPFGRRRPLGNARSIGPPKSRPIGSRRREAR